MVLLSFGLLLPVLCLSQVVGGPCEGCEAIYEYGQNELSWTDTLPDYSSGDDKMIVQGVVYAKNGKPASEVIIYIYHTNKEGIYPTRQDSRGWERRHGYLRGWVKTSADGRYAFYTQRPGAYPSRSEPEHIHVTVKEPGIKEYYLDSFHFKDDPLLTEKETFRNYGGSGIVNPVKSGNQWIVTRDLFLGKNIIAYPE